MRSGSGWIFSLRDVSERGVQQDQVDTSAIIFDYFANRNQAGTTPCVTGLNWVSSCLIMMIVFYLWRQKIMFLKTSSIPKTNETMTLFSPELMRPERRRPGLPPKTLVLTWMGNADLWPWPTMLCCAVVDSGVMRGALRRDYWPPWSKTGKYRRRRAINICYWGGIAPRQTRRSSLDGRYGNRTSSDHHHHHHLMFYHLYHRLLWCDSSQWIRLRTQSHKIFMCERKTERDALWSEQPPG